MNTIACIFAHPDDEAFGPGGTIAKLAQRNRVYVLSATKGEAGKDSQKHPARALHERRAAELRASAKILGVKRVFFLGFADGTLSNSRYHALAAKIEKILKRVKADVILTFEPRGVSGHIDHIMVSMVSSYVFERMRAVKTMLYFCMSAARRQRMKNYFIYVPPGYRKKEIDLTVDIRDVWKQKLKAMLAHTSQIHDSKRVLAFARQFPKEEYFLVRSKLPDGAKRVRKLY